MIGGADEHVAFLLLRALELQGEVLKAYRYAVIYETLDPEVTESSCTMPLLMWIEFVVGFRPSADVCFLFFGNCLVFHLLQNRHSEFPDQPESSG